MRDGLRASQFTKFQNCISVHQCDAAPYPRHRAPKSNMAEAAAKKLLDDMLGSDEPMLVRAF